MLLYYTYLGILEGNLSENVKQRFQAMVMFYVLYSYHLRNGAIRI